MASFMLGILFVVEVIVALLMVAVVMLQPPKDPSGGMNAVAGGSFGEEVFGGRTGNVLSKTTVVLGVILILNSLVIAYAMRKGDTSRGLLSEPVETQQPAEVPAQ